MGMKNLLTMTPEEAYNFLNSFDHLVSDCDGVLWNPTPIDRVPEAISKLKSLGKSVNFVSNNCMKSFEAYIKQFSKIGVDLKIGDIVYPTMGVVDYLRKINFTKKAFVVGTDEFIGVIKNAGFQVVVGLKQVEESLHALVNGSTDDDPEVEAVIMDFDYNFNTHKLYKMLSFLERPDMKFIIAATDKKFPVSRTRTLAGPGLIENMLIEMSGKHPIRFGKPSAEMKHLANRTFKLNNPERTIFIGDMIEQDMAFGHECGFRKLMVLSGNDTLKSAIKLTDERLKPDLYIESLGHMVEVIEKAGQFKP